jgi:O-antigen/teichoic acid export membrane protein
MHANIGSLPDDAAPVEKPADRLISIPYLLLRVTTAGGAFVMGFVQTFVFARVLSPERFSIFIVVGAIGYTLWFTDLGLAKILFVHLRAAFLAGKRDERAAREATAVILFYVLLGIAASLVCMAIGMAQPSASWRDVIELALFLLYITLNLAWFSLRTVSIAADVFLYYEKLELTRRVVVISTMLAMLAGLPFIAFLIGANLLWAVLLTLAARKLVRRGALAARLDGFVHELISFFRFNGRSIARSSTSALSGVLVATFPYYFVPAAFGLGAAPIILEVTMRIFRGGSVIYSAACDLTLPGQTRAAASRDLRRLVRTTALAIGLCSLPALFGCAVLIFAGDPLFHFLLRSAATVPPQIKTILVVLLLFNVIQIVSETLLQHTGYFRNLARVGALVAILMVLAMALSIVAKFDIVGFLAAYTAVFVVGAVCLAAGAIMGPIRAAATRPGEQQPSDAFFRAIHSGRQALSAIPIRPDPAHRIPQPNQNP